MLTAVVVFPVPPLLLRTPRFMMFPHAFRMIAKKMMLQMPVKMRPLGDRIDRNNAGRVEFLVYSGILIITPALVSSL